VKVCDRLRPVLPEVLALSANSPFLDGRNSGLHSVRSQIFTKSFPRCGIPDPFGGWEAYADYVDFLVKTGSIVEQTQIWWSIRPHHTFGTVELRVCDAQSGAAESTALEALLAACIAQAALDIDEGVPFDDPAPRFIEENFWRAIRWGLGGDFIDLETGELVDKRKRIEELIEWVQPVADEIGAAPFLGVPTANAAERQIARYAEGATLEEIYAEQIVREEERVGG
jgi:carboxylate-amine ligase